MPIRLASVTGYEQVVQKGMVTPGRLELPTRSLGNCCSIHLSYGAILVINHLLQVKGFFLFQFRPP